MIFISVEKKIKLFYKKTKAQQQRNLLILNTELKLPAEPGGGGGGVPTFGIYAEQQFAKTKTKAKTSLELK